MLAEWLANAGSDATFVIIVIVLVLIVLNDWHESH